MQRIYLQMFLWFFVTNILWGQEGRRCVLKDVIKEVEQQNNISFTFDPQSIDGIKVICPNSSLGIDSLIYQLQQNSAFNFVKYDESNYGVEPKKVGRNFLIKGLIIDEEEEIPLPNASILLRKSGSRYTSNNAGNFNIIASYDPSDTLIVKYVGFEALKIPFSVLNDKGVAKLILKPSLNVMKEVSIEAYLSSGVDYIHSDQSLVLNVSDASLLPGETDNDIFVGIEALPGVDSPNGQAGNLIVRGSDADKTLITFDDIPIYHKGHYLGTFSPYNAQVIENVKVQRNGYYGAEKGGRVGGLIEIRSKDYIPDSIQSGVGIATSYASAYTHIPIVENKAALLVGLRSSIPGNTYSPKIQAINDFVFSESEVEAAKEGINGYELTDFRYNFFDVNTKFVYNINDKIQFRSSFIHIRNNLLAVINDGNFNAELSDTNTLQNTGGSVGLVAELTNGWTTELNAALSTYNLKVSGFDRVENQVRSSETYINDVEDWQLKYIMSKTINRYSSLNFGYNLNFHRISNERAIIYNLNEALSRRNVLRNEGVVHSLFGDYKSFIGDWLQFGTGLRSIYYEVTDEFFFEPRLAVNFFLNPDFTIKANYGVQHQFVNQINGLNVSSLGGVQITNWHLSDGKGISVLRSDNYMIGTMLEKGSWLIDVEFYIKNTQNVLLHDYNNDQNDIKFLSGNSYAKGIDVLVRKNLDFIEAWAGYSHSLADLQFDSIRNGERFEYVWNQNNIFSLGYTFKYKNLSVSMGWRYKTGLPALPGLRTLYLVGATSTPGANTPATNNTPGTAIPPMSETGNNPPTRPRPPMPKGSGNGNMPPRPMPPRPMPEDNQPPLPVQTNNDPNSSPSEPEFIEGSVEEYFDDFPAQHQLDISVSYKIKPKNKKWSMIIGGSIINVYDQKNIINQVARPVGNQLNQRILVNQYGLGFAPSAQVMIKF